GWGNGWGWGWGWGRGNNPFFPNDPAFPSQYELRQITAPAGWRHGGKGQGVTIAVLDTGGNLIAELDGKLQSGLDAYQYVVSGQILPGNHDTDPAALGHGTAVACSAAANTNNGIGTASPAQSSQIYPVIISDSTGQGFDS